MCSKPATAFILTVVCNNKNEPMNKLSYYIIGIIGVLIILTNCKKDDDLADVNSGIATKHPTPVWEGNWLAV